MLNIDINIKEQKQILKDLKDYTNHDFSRFAPELIEHRLEIFFSQSTIRSTEELCAAIKEQPNIRKQVLKTLYTQSSEMLRDPSCWEQLSKLIVKKFKKNEEIKIWFPIEISGEEIYSLRIFLDQTNMGKKSNILVYTPTQYHKNDILAARYEAKKLAQFKKNLEIIKKTEKITPYIHYNNQSFSINTDLFKDNLTIKIRQYKNADFKNEFDIVIFRNRFIELNETAHIETLNMITNSLKKGGILVTGVKENLKIHPSKKYKAICKNEPIYKKIKSL